MPGAGFSSLLRKSRLWLLGFALWVSILWILSGKPPPEVSTLDLPGFDKILHFVYFLIGAVLLSITLHLRGSYSWIHNLVVVVIALAMIGAIDEWHQSWIPGRSGNDLGDWIADLLGGLSGALICKPLHALRKPAH